MPEETRGLDARYQALIRNVLQQAERIILPYIIWEARVLFQEDFVAMALEKIDPIPRLIVTLQYRLDEPGKAETFTPRNSQYIRRTAKGRIPNTVNIPVGIKALRNLEISPPFAAFLMPTPEEIFQLKETVKNMAAQLEETQQARDELSGELEGTRTRLATVQEEKQALQRKLDSQLWRRIRRLFS